MINNKLLHEYLKESVAKNESLGTDIVILSTDNCFITLKSEEASAIAHEIERYYIPRPRFEDGEPVQFGDIATGENRGYTENGEEIDIYTGVVIEFDYRDTGQEVLEVELENGDDVLIEAIDDYRFKRPAPKVLDADGIEIKPGDTVYSVENGKQATVSAVGKFNTEYSSGNVMLDDCEECYLGTSFTHNKPDSFEKLRDDIINTAEEIAGRLFDLASM